jgi:hypothetical protein
MKTCALMTDSSLRQPPAPVAIITALGEGKKVKGRMAGAPAALCESLGWLPLKLRRMPPTIDDGTDHPVNERPRCAYGMAKPVDEQHLMRCLTALSCAELPDEAP